MKTVNFDQKTNAINSEKLDSRTITFQFENLLIVVNVKVCQKQKRT